jgi:uncharacterized peroxidase-related enzyme
MPRIQPRPRSLFVEHEPMLRGLEEFFGFLPNDYLTMGHKPAVMAAVSELTQAVVFSPGKTTLKLRLLVAYSVSRAAACMYCVAHCGALAIEQGISLDQIQNILSFETHSKFTSEEKAALRVASRAGKTPNEVTDDDFNTLKTYFDEEGCAEIVAVIALMGFYNRWNDTVATTLERPPLDIASQHLSQYGWGLGKHGEQLL